MLVAHDQLIEQPCILSLQTLSDRQAFLPDKFLGFTSF
jgi:hypothetical protein